MYVEYCIELDEVVSIGSSHRWTERYPEHRPEHYQLGCATCGRVYCRATLLSNPDADHSFVTGQCFSCFQAKRRARSSLSRICIPGSFLLPVRWDTYPAMFDVASNELLRLEFLHRYEYWTSGGYL